jgi:Sigma-70 region 2
MQRAGRTDYELYVAARAVALRRTGYLLCGDWNRAEELAQAALVRLYVHWRRASRADNLDAYARTVLVRCWPAASGRSGPRWTGPAPSSAGYGSRRRPGRLRGRAGRRAGRLRPGAGPGAGRLVHLGRRRPRAPRALPQSMHIIGPIGADGRLSVSRLTRSREVLQATRR